VVSVVAAIVVHWRDERSWAVAFGMESVTSNKRGVKTQTKAT